VVRHVYSSQLRATRHTREALDAVDDLRTRSDSAR